MIMLAGIVVNNAIVLVDYINTPAAARAGSYNEAIVEAGQRAPATHPDDHRHHRCWASLPDGPRPRRRRRDPHADGDLRESAGLVTSTFLTLIVVPVVYSIELGARA